MQLFYQVKGADDEVVLALVIPWRYPTNPLKGSDSRELEKKASGTRKITYNTLLLFTK